MTNCKVISFINMKGGVGKTTLCLSLGEYLARFKNRKVLFIDVDPQFNLTQSLLNEFNLEDQYLDDIYKNRNICNIFASSKSVSEKDSIPVASDLIIDLDDKMSLIPGSIDLIFEDSKNDIGKTMKINKFIKSNNLNETYHYIFIDCPPTISLYTDSALYASDYYLVPNRVDRYSILGIKLLKQVVDRLVSDMEIKIMPLGIVYTILDNDLTDKTKKLMDVFEKDKIVQEMGLFTNTTTFVRDLAVGYQGNIASKYSRSKEDIANIADEFESLI
ncbi:AAA family ATPase [Tissierella sp. MB52-C2]|uniref:ParA family protein n=1 Tax=Tissierella sp. MB52-C2 TaxID=3070999 RepID=UPI00280C10F0|nr:AAA family ATPase [Tissierella sp. MB52-C2]WMM24029.1 AAA family ATPase [Tissierella sp. MB52-C2]